MAEQEQDVWDSDLERELEEAQARQEREEAEEQALGEFKESLGPDEASASAEWLDELLGQEPAPDDPDPKPDVLEDVEAYTAWLQRQRERKTQELQAKIAKQQAEADDLAAWRQSIEHYSQ